MIRYVFIFANGVSLALGLISLSSLHRIPPTIPDAIVVSTGNLSKDQVVSKLIESSIAVDDASNLLWFFLYGWIAISVLNLILLVVSMLSTRPIR